MKFVVATLALSMAPLIAQAIDAPTGLESTQNGARSVEWTWQPVDGATQYEVTVNGAAQGLTSGTTFQSEGLHRGDASLHLRAVDGSGNYSYQSRTLKIQVSDDAAPAQASPDASVQAPTTERRAGTRNDIAVNAADTGLIDPASWQYSEVSEKAGYELVFSDEFNGGSLNPARWNAQLRWDGDWNGERYEYRVINGEDQFYVNPLSADQEHLDTVVPAYNPFQFDGERLAIRAKKNPLKTTNDTKTWGPLRDIVKQQDFMSGVISTYDKFYRKYGYFEARIKIPNHDGTFPAFWLFHQKRRSEGTQKTEIDIMENLGHAPWYIYNSFHYFKDVSSSYGGRHQFIKPTPSGQIYSGTDYSDNFHTYAVKWEPGHIVWYIDGQQVSEVYSDAGNYEELYLQINLAMGGNWTNFPTSAGGLGRSRGNHFPNADDLANFSDPALEIDYVRVYAPR